MTDLDRQEENPYAPPQVESSGVGIPVLRTHPGEELQATRISALPWPDRLHAWNWPIRRQIRFTGQYEGVVEWIPGLWESVSVDDEVVLSVKNLNWRVIPRFEFPVHAGRLATMVVEVRVRLVWIVTAFRIRLDGRTLYEEGEWPGDPPAEGASDGS